MYFIPPLVIFYFVMLSVDIDIFNGGFTGYFSGRDYPFWDFVWRFGLMCLVGYPLLAIHAKRWHDRNKSLWWQLISLIPIIGPIWVSIELGFLKGTKGINRYDPEYVPPPQPILMLSCVDCEFSVKKEEFKDNNLFCPDCGSRLEEA